MVDRNYTPILVRKATPLAIAVTITTVRRPLPIKGSGRFAYHPREVSMVT